MSDFWQSPVVVPAVAYKDVPRAAGWLEAAFGFIERKGSRLVGDGWILTWLEVQGGGLIHLTTGGHGLTSPEQSGFASQSLKVYVKAIDEHFQNAKSHGAEPIMQPQDMFWGGRVYRAKDIEGHVWEFSQIDQELSADQWRLPPNTTRS